MSTGVKDDDDDEAPPFDNTEAELTIVVTVGLADTRILGVPTLVLDTVLDIAALVEDMVIGTGTLADVGITLVVPLLSGFPPTAEDEVTFNTMGELGFCRDTFATDL